MLLLLAIFSLSHEIAIYHTNDILGGFSPTQATFMNPDFPPPLGRGPSLSTLLSNARNKNPDLLLLDAGNSMPDVILPENIDWKMYADIMNYLSYDAVAIGTSDLSYGVGTLEAMANTSNFPLLCANLTGKDTELGFVKPYHIVEREGIKIVIFGLISERAPLMLPRKHREDESRKTGWKF